MANSVNFGELQKAAAEQGYTNPPAGSYLMEVSKSAYKKSSGGNDMITIVLKVANPGPHMGATQPHNLVASANSMGFFNRYMSALGYDAATLAGYSHMATDQVLQMLAPQLIGKRVAADIGPDPKDATRLVVTKMARPPAGADAIAAAPLTPVSVLTQAAAVSTPPPPPVTAAPTEAAPEPPF